MNTEHYRKEILIEPWKTDVNDVNNDVIISYNGVLLGSALTKEDAQLIKNWLVYAMPDIKRSFLK